MIYFISFLILIYFLGPCLSWLLKSKNTDEINFLFENSQNFTSIVKRFEWDKTLSPSEEILITKAGGSMEEIFENLASFKPCMTILKFSHYKAFIKIFGNILFTKEIAEYGIKVIRCNRISNFFRIFWLNHDKTDSTRLMIQKLFKKHFPFIENDEIHHIVPPLFKRNLLSHFGDIKIRNESRMFRHQENLFQIYNKKGANFNGRVTLVCLLHPQFQNRILDITMTDIKEATFGEHVRFGAYIHKRDSLLKSFAFYQSNSIDSNKNNIEKTREISSRGFIVSQMILSSNLENLDQFLNFITDIAFNQCQ